MAGALTVTATTACTTLTLLPGLYTTPVAAPATTSARPVLAVQTFPEQTWLEAQIAAWRHVVKTGETLSGIAVSYCGHANDWTGFYVQNKKTIGNNPNLIYPGQVLNLSRCTDPPRLLRLGSTYHAPRHAVVRAATRNGKTWKVTYGYPYTCGDGDGDGWDKACGTTHPAGTSHRTAVRSAARPSVSYSGHYSYAGLEALWEAAGGPAWAASHAAEIAECESGGNTGAYNPSGATGLWQILGSVIGGDLRNPMVNAENAVAKFKASGDTFAQWVCR